MKISGDEMNDTFTQEEMAEMRVALKAEFESAFGSEAFSAYYMKEFNLKPSMNDDDDDLNKADIHSPLIVYFMACALGRPVSLSSPEVDKQKLRNTFRVVALKEGASKTSSDKPEAILADIHEVVDLLLNSVPQAA